MEDSYVVHRRRKAAARKREKTPDPSSRGASRVDASDGEDEDMRARMEKMAEDAERAEQRKESRMTEEKPKEPTDKDQNKNGTGKSVRAKEKRGSRNMDEDMIAVRAEVAAKMAGNDSKTRETDAADKSTQPVRKTATEATNRSDNETTKREVTTEVVVKERIVQETSRIPKETSGDTAKPAEVRKVERRLKRKSKERAERQSLTTDSSDVDEKSESSRRRTVSPEVARSRTRKSAKSRSSDPQVQAKDPERFHREKRSSSRQKTEDSEPPQTDNSKKSESRSHSQFEDTDEDSHTMKKSKSFPQKSGEEFIMKRSVTDLKKQIIPLSNDSLIEDFERAQREYLLRERSILDPEPADAYQTAKSSSLRRRKFSLPHADDECEEITRDVIQPRDTTDTKKRSWFSWLFFRFRKRQDTDAERIEDESEHISRVEEVTEPKREAPEKVTLLDFFRALKDVVGEFRAFVAQNPRDTTIIRRLHNRCMAELLLVMIYCGLGAFVFRFVEGAFESFYKCGVKRVKRDFLDNLWDYSHNLREDDWKSMARKKLMEFEEQLHTAHEAGVHTYSGQKSWTFLNAVGYCLSVITTIGYGHISPSTNTGRAITIIYAIFGIPMFLIILADFGKLFTRGIKFLWAFVRRLYYTGSCRKVRRTVPVQEVMKGVQLVYDLATFRRPSQMNPEEIEEMQKQQVQQPQTVLNLDANAPDTPETPAMSTFAVDDEFNLPISVAIFILLGYIFVGATLYYMWEDWGFFESFYFVFISMSTIGFGDYVPKHPIYMMCSIVYLVFGLALTSMCINVVQVKLSDSFRQASQKIGATIGFEIAEDDNSVKPAAPPPIEVADVHTGMKESESGGKIAPKAKQEDVDL